MRRWWGLNTYSVILSTIPTTVQVAANVFTEDKAQGDRTGGSSSDFPLVSDLPYSANRELTIPQSCLYDGRQPEKSRGSALALDPGTGVVV
jgi:hypothetical protein